MQSAGRPEIRGNSAEIREFPCSGLGRLCGWFDCPNNGASQGRSIHIHHRLKASGSANRLRQRQYYTLLKMSSDITRKIRKFATCLFMSSDYSDPQHTISLQRSPGYSLTSSKSGDYMPNKDKLRQSQCLSRDCTIQGHTVYTCIWPEHLHVYLMSCT